MNWIKRPLLFVTCSVPFLLELATIPNLTAQAQTQVNPTLLSQPQKPPLLISQGFKPPKRGLPPASAGGATRGRYCVQKNQSLTPLMPKENLGLTFAERPTFFWHVPASSVKTAQFVILAEANQDNNDDDDVVYETTLNVPTKPGIMKFTLPASATPLKVGKRYHWYLTLVCDEQNPIRNPNVEGWVERAQPEPTLTKALQQADARKRPGLYAEAGIWHEALSSYIDLRCSEPNNLKVKSDWGVFLQSVGLNAFAADPIIDCCTNNK
ncbi:hypothetical protein NIES37_05680 [Tolypothrix tenuis PCC 7101]|uniref:DUF928 domain-containing protein n=1 Tax=Tolypothrix tenuis PCC 7101 TaxID=231146 RepID=A0A1Z4MT54_9CYAN|nr:DUF928 domain-containing protein [Aulosira sp. FACHB-113]BAY96634.1 hypothetical protein NIES37_05680 [Tolypothrix tenuis PCC 7101]BAZ72859.1 hypothetical protein NIES50_14160 [Aulosira laxa NIES-50]